MGRNDDTWSDRHRSAIGYAICEQKLSSTAAIEAAKRGELGLEPFSMPASTARQIAQQYERGEIPRPEIADTAEDTALRLQAYLNKRLAKLLEKDEPRFTAVRQLAEEQKAILAIATSQKANRNKTPSDDITEAEERHDVPALLQSLKQNGLKTETEDAAPVQSHEPKPGQG